MYLRKNRKIYLVMGFTDMRKQINGLAQITEAKKPKELLSGNYFVFLGKTRRVMKILYWDKTGFCLWTKRLEEDSFPWPKKRDGVMRTDRENFRLLLMGIDIFKKHTAKRYYAVY